MHRLPSALPQRPVQPVYAVKSTVQQQQQASSYRPRILNRGAQQGSAAVFVNIAPTNETTGTNQVSPTSSPALNPTIVLNGNGLAPNTTTIVHQDHPHQFVVGGQQNLAKATIETELNLLNQQQVFLMSPNSNNTTSTTTTSVLSLMAAAQRQYQTIGITSPTVPVPVVQKEAPLIQVQLGQTEIGPLPPGSQLQSPQVKEKAQATRKPDEMVVFKLDDRHIINPCETSGNIVIDLYQHLLLSKQESSAGLYSPIVSPTSGFGITKPKQQEGLITDDKDKVVIKNLVDELIDNVIINSRSTEPYVEKKQKFVKVEKADKVLPDFEPIVWEAGIGRLPGTELTFHVSDRGRLELYCPFLPIKEKMDRAVEKANIRRKNNPKKPKTKPVPIVEQLPQIKTPKVKATPASNQTPPKAEVAKRPRLSVQNPRKKTPPVYKPDIDTSDIQPPVLKIEVGDEGEIHTKKPPGFDPVLPMLSSEVVINTPISSSSVFTLSSSSSKVIATTFCSHCSFLGDVTSFVDGKYCTDICERSSKALREEQTRRRLSLTISEQQSNQESRAPPSKPKQAKKPRLSKPKPEKPKVDVKPTLPESSSKNNQFIWTNYLNETKSRAAPARFFRQPAMPPANPFKVGMMMEAIDPQHQSLFCVVEVAEIQGYRIRLRFTGYSEVYDFWVNADSFDIFPPGWCEENGQTLQAPGGYQSGKAFNWHQYIVDNELNTASRHFFAISHEDTAAISEVKVGMKLEAVDLRNLNYICVATVGNVIGERFLIHFDSWDNLFDYWTDLTSPFIHAVGWCAINGRDLVPPQWGDEPETSFSWEQYLKETKSVAMPAKLFRPLEPIKFKKGMRLECVDKRNPALVRVASISEVEAHFITIHFDNWPDKYDYKVYELSPEIHPVGWCAHTGHPLQSPPPSDDSFTWINQLCQVFGCYGLGHIQAPKFTSHNNEKSCPYSEGNYLTDWTLADRLTSISSTDENKSEKPPTTNVKSRRLSINKKAAPSRRSSKGSIKEQPSPPAPPASTPIIKERLGRASRRSEVTDLPRRTTRRGKRLSAEVEEHTKKPESKKPRRASAKEQTSVPAKKKKSIDINEASTFDNEVQDISTTKELTIQIPTVSNVEEEDSVLSKETALVQVAPSTPTNENLEPTENCFQSVSVPAQIKTEPVQSIAAEPRPATLFSMKAPIHPLACVPYPLQTEPHVPSEMMPVVIAPSAYDHPDNDVSYNFNKHIQALQRLVGDLNAVSVSEWGIEEVAKLIVKLGCSADICERFKEQKIDGDSFLLLTQRDITGLGFPLGPTLKISHAIRLINKAR